MNFLNAYEIDWKRVSIIGAILVLIGIIGTLVYGYYSNQKEKEAKHVEKYEEIVEYISVSEGAAAETEKIIQFIYNHAPVQVDTLDILVRDIWDTVSYKQDKDEEPFSQQEKAFFATLYQALDESNINTFLGLFDPYSYINYLNGFDTAEDKEQALSNVISQLTLQGNLESMSYYKVSNGNSLEYRVMLEYKDGKSKTVDLSLKTAAKDQHSYSKHNLFIKTPIENIIDSL